MNGTFDLAAQPPWFHVVVTSKSQITDFAWGLGRISDHVVVRFLRGSKMSTINDMHNEVGAALQFPWYYGENWAALDECINDLDWLPADSYFLIITEADRVLRQENQQEFKYLIDCLRQSASEWAREVASSDNIRRSPVPFHTIFQCAENDKDAFIARLKLTRETYREFVLPHDD